MLRRPRRPTGAQPCKGGGTYPGAVIGGAPKAKGAPFGDIYFSFEFSTQFGYLLATRHGIDVTSNSYGSSAADNDGYDAASQEADLLYNGTRTTPVFSTGNGAPGFGTATAPQPLAGIAVGASTQFGGTGWDSIKNESQITDNDVMVWSNRGPQATGGNGVDVVADGAFSPGDLTLNSALDGRVAWETWGGTSRSTPVTVAATALVYQAWRQSHGGTIPAGFYATAKRIVKSSAQDLGYESWIQGSGSVDAARAVRVASGTDAFVSPDNWRPGNYRGTEYPVFTRTLSPGQSDSQTFTVNGPGTWTVSDRYMKRTASQSMSFTSSNLSNESTYNFNAPDYLVDLTSLVQSHPDADLMVVRANYPRNEFDPNGDYTADQAWRLLTYNWTDVNHDGNLWTDSDGDGVVDHKVRKKSTNIDGDVDLNFPASEMDKGEYIRFMYHRAGSNALQSFVRDPAARTADGIFLGLQHSERTNAIPVTHFKIRIDFYDNVDWPWVTTTPVAGGAFAATMNVPADAPYGMYDGAVVLNGGGENIVVPVSVTVGATATQDADGKLTGQLRFGGADTAASQSDLLYDNGSFFGANDWTWREESGDWRFFYVDVPDEPAEGSVFLSDTTWDDAAPYTDLDTLVFGPSANSYQLLGGSAPFGGPYILDTVGASARAYLGSGTWAFDTATGGAEDVVTAPVQEGLHAVVQHGVSYDGDKFDVPFETTLGSAVVNPTEVEQIGVRRQRLVRRHVRVDGRPLRPRRRGLRPQPAGDEHRDGSPGRPERPGDGEREEDVHDRARVAGHVRGAPAEQRHRPLRPQGRPGDRLLDQRDRRRVRDPDPARRRYVRGVGARVLRGWHPDLPAHVRRGAGIGPVGERSPVRSGSRRHAGDAPRGLRQVHDRRSGLLRRAPARAGQRSDCAARPDHDPPQLRTTTSE